jgi:hypothetical protein
MLAPYTFRSIVALALLFCGTPNLLHAQVSYAFQATSATYEPVADYTVCDFDGDGFDRINELDGELFHFFGVPFPVGDDHPLHIGDFGFVRVDNDSSLIIMDGLFTTLEPHDQNSEVRYAITGTTGARTLTVEWHRWHLSNGPGINFASWQVRMEQGTGAITIHIGPNSGGTNLFTNISGPNCGIFYSPVDFSGCYEKIWVEGAPDAIVVDSAANYDFDALFGFPEANTLYRFTPRTATTDLPAAPIVGLAQLVVSGTQLNLEWPAAPAPLAITILDATGRTVQRSSTAQDTWRFNSTALPSGVYFLKAQAGEAVYTARFVRP